MANNLSYKLTSEAVTSAMTNTILGNDVSLASIAGSAVGGMASYKMLGNFQVASNNRLGNIVAELGHSSLSGAISQVSGGMVTNALSGRNVFSNMNQNFRYGIAGGFSSGAAKIAMLGGAIRPDEETMAKLEQAYNDHEIEYRPVFRSGGLFGQVHRLVGGILGNEYTGLTIGRDLLVYDKKNAFSILHEGMHYLQESRGSWVDIWGRLFVEQFRKNPYGRELSLEWIANELSGYYQY